MHNTQKVLLKRLLNSGQLRFAELARGYTYEDNVVFHIKQLASRGLVAKQANTYALTTKGVQAITDFDVSSLEDTGFKTFFVGFVYQHDGEYLLKEHPQAEQPFYNLPSGKPRFGEDLNQALVRIFKDHTGLELPPSAFTFTSLHLKTVASGKEVLFDDAFCIYTVAPSDGPLQLGEHIVAMNKTAIATLPQRWPEVNMCVLDTETATYRTYTIQSDYILA